MTGPGSDQIEYLDRATGARGRLLMKEMPYAALGQGYEALPVATAASTARMIHAAGRAPGPDVFLETFLRSAAFGYGQFAAATPIRRSVP